MQIVATVGSIMGGPRTLGDMEVRARLMSDGSSALKILLVEDSAIDAELAAYELAKLGMAVEWNRVSIEEALRQALLEFCPSVILSDHSMPAFDGLSKAVAAFSSTERRAGKTVIRVRP